MVQRPSTKDALTVVLIVGGAAGAVAGAMGWAGKAVTALSVIVIVAGAGLAIDEKVVAPRRQDRLDRAERERALAADRAERERALAADRARA